MIARARLLIAAAVLALSGTIAAATPWPGGRAPDAEAVAVSIEQATTEWEKDRLLEYLRSVEDEQDSRIVAIDQTTIDIGLADLVFMQRYGHQMFHLAFDKKLGRGGVVPGPALARVHRGAGGGLDSHACAGCHSVGGRDGAGAATENAFVEGDGERASSANVRNPPALLGSGLVQALAFEMSRDLAKQRDGAIARAAENAAPVAVELASKGVRFGRLVAKPDGSIDSHGLEGVDADLVVRPFGWKGEVATLRRFTEEAALVHFGVQSSVLVGQGSERLGRGADEHDPDGDGVQREIEEGSITLMAIYLAMLETPVILPPSSPALIARWGRGQARFEAIGCASCHVSALPLNDRVWHEASDTGTAPGVELDLLRDGDQPRGNDRVRLFSDLKRHDMGEELADRHDAASGLGKRVFLTRPLWGLAETAPYLHDGRAATVPEAILAHGGEARAARDAFAKLSPDEQADVQVFLLSLTRSPKLRLPL